MYACMYACIYACMFGCKELSQAINLYIYIHMLTTMNETQLAGHVKHIFKL